MMEGEVKECSTDRSSEETVHKKHLPLLHKWLFLSVLWHFSNARHEKAACLFLWFLFRVPALHFLSDPQKTETYLALATRRVSLKRKRCLSWVCRPVFSCTWAWPKKRRAGHSARKAWTRGHDSGLTGVRQLSLRTEEDNKRPPINSKQKWWGYLISLLGSCLYVPCCQSMTLMDGWKQRGDFQEEKEVVWERSPFLFTLSC